MCVHIPLQTWGIVVTNAGPIIVRPLITPGIWLLIVAMNLIRSRSESRIPLKSRVNGSYRNRMLLTPTTPRSLMKVFLQA